jgi:hypothetical protein
MRPPFCNWLLMVIGILGGDCEKADLSILKGYSGS